MQAAAAGCALVGRCLALASGAAFLASVLLAPSRARRKKEVQQ